MPRWWPALLILALAGMFFGWVWGFQDVQRQDKNLETIAAACLALLLLWLWFVFFSRLPRRLRLAVAAGSLACLGLALALLEVKGVTGDFMPILGWRWQPAQSSTLSSLNPAPPAAAARTTPSLPGNDYPQFLGPDRNSRVTGLALARDWERHPPQELWRRPVGAGWSGFATFGARAVTLEQQGENEVVACYELTTGRPLWSHAYPAHFHTTIAGEGPRTVPTIVEGRVYTLGGTGRLNCLTLEAGRLVWSKDVLEDNSSELPPWGVSCSPLVYNQMVVVSAGGANGRSLVAYHSEDGRRLWAGGDQPSNYSSPVLCQLADVTQVLIFNEGGVYAHAADSGQVLWHHPWRRGHPHVTNPLPLPGDRVLVSSGYGTGSQLLQVRKQADGAWSAETLWKSIRLKSKFANLITWEGHVYGLDDGILVCLDLESGQLRWKEGRYGHGQLILVDGLLLIVAENGQVVLLEPNPREHRELTCFTAFKVKTWNPPALASPYLLLRNDQEAACYLLPRAGHESRADLHIPPTSSRPRVNSRRASSWPSRSVPPK